MFHSEIDISNQLQCFGIEYLEMAITTNNKLIVFQAVADEAFPSTIRIWIGEPLSCENLASDHLRSPQIPNLNLFSQI